jgi:transposase
MESKDLLSRLLHFGDGWEIKEIIVNNDMKEIDVYIEYLKPTGICSDDNVEYAIYDYGEMRRIRHLDLFEYKTYIDVRIPRVINAKSEISTMKLDWAGSRVSYSYLFEYKVIKTLIMSKNQTKTAEYFETSFDIIHGIMERAVARGLKRRTLDGIQTLSLDEKSYKNGQKYMTILSDPMTKAVIDIIEGRKIEDVEELISWTLSPAQLNQISIVTMDMWKPYMKVAEALMPQADIVHDKFHTAKYLNNAVNDVRKEEVKKQEELKHTKYIFLKNKENWTEEQRLKFEEINQINALTAHAWQIKENFKGIYNQWDKKQCLLYFGKWYIDVLNAGIKQMMKVADTMLCHLKGIVNSAVSEFTNSVAENLNSQIQVVKSVGHGFANVNGYRNSILFFQGKLSLFPL